MSELKGEETIKILREITLLRALSDDEIQAIFHVGKALKCEPHANILIEGELSWGLYLILDGVVGIFKTNKMTGDSFDIGQLESGSYFGEMSLLDENPRSATVRAITACQLFYISKEDFLKILDQNQDLKLRFLKAAVEGLIERIRDLDDSYIISQVQLWQTAFKRGRGLR